MHYKNLKDRLIQELESFQELESLLADPEITSNPLKLKDITREHNRLSRHIPEVKNFLDTLFDLEGLEEILSDSKADQDMKNMAREELPVMESRLKELQGSVEMILVPADPNSGKSLIMEIRAGTGGEEAALFAGDLYRMYIKFAEENGMKFEMISESETGLGGYKEVIFSIAGSSAWDLLHREAGIHRVQRIPQTESGGRIHTSAVTVAVMPEREETEVNLDEKDLKIDVYRASGAGGQHVNKTESAVRILHIPSGLVVSCQDERSQLKNRARAMRVLRARLAEKIEEEQHALNAQSKKEQVKSGDRSERIRTYNFPQGRITDHRIGYTNYNLSSFMEGDITELLNELLRDEKEEKLKKLD